MYYFNKINGWLLVMVLFLFMVMFVIVLVYVEWIFVFIFMVFKIIIILFFDMLLLFFIKILKMLFVSGVLIDWEEVEVDGVVFLVWGCVCVWELLVGVMFVSVFEGVILMWYIFLFIFIL